MFFLLYNYKISLLNKNTATAIKRRPIKHNKSTFKPKPSTITRKRILQKTSKQITERIQRKNRIPKRTKPTQTGKPANIKPSTHLNSRIKYVAKKRTRTGLKMQTNARKTPNF